MKLLLHICCGPCASGAVPWWQESAGEIVGFFYNPNIHPLLEYRRRLTGTKEVCGLTDIRLVVDESYDPDAWFAAVVPGAGDDRRCRRCIALRLERAAQEAVAHGCDAFSTTLSISPWQDHEAIASEGERLGALHGVEFLYRDLRALYPETKRRSREWGIYRQKYCGCLLSEWERYRKPQTVRPAKPKALADVQLRELDFHIPEEQIAQRPVEPRDACRLMVLQADGRHCHARFSDLPSFLRAGDTLVLNDSRVLPARVFVRKPSGGEVELLFLQRVPGATSGECEPKGRGSGDGSEVWEALARPSHRLKAGSQLVAPNGTQLRLVSSLGGGRWLVGAPAGTSLTELMQKHGLMPLPPYIKSYPEEPASYQTVYAAVPGSAAAPTAGLHFTSALLDRLRDSGIRAAYVTLHVGLDTFQPIREEKVEEHKIHREAYSVGRESLEIIRTTRECGGRIVAVGTTATRVLETLAESGALDPEGDLAEADSISGSTDIFITPGYRFRAVDLLLTNFHLPRSTVLALTMAFAGRERLLKAYAEAIELGYRFFSFGDAMLIEPCAGRPCAATPSGDRGGDCADT